MRRNRVYLALGGITIVAGLAVIADAGMVEGCRFEAARVMAHTAILGSRHVTGFFRCREPGSVTG